MLTKISCIDIVIESPEKPFCIKINTQFPDSDTSSAESWDLFARSTRKRLTSEGRYPLRAALGNRKAVTVTAVTRKSRS